MLGVLDLLENWPSLRSTCRIVPGVMDTEKAAHAAALQAAMPAGIVDTAIVSLTSQVVRF